MNLLPFEQFAVNFGDNAAVNRMNLSLYKGYWQCACGKTHYMIFQHNIICQGYWKVMVHCPENPKYITAVKINTGLLGLKFKGYESFAFCRLSSDEDILAFSLFTNLLS